MFHVINVRSAKILTDELNLVFGVGAGEERLPLKHLGEDTTHTPHIH